MKVVLQKPVETSMQRMSALATLPVFFDLKGRRSIVLGGSAAASWKAELLAAAGSDVEIYADDIGNEMACLLGRGAAAGSLRHQASCWSSDTFIGASLVIADAETDEEAKTIYHAAVSASVPVNVIDKPDFCQFQFGSIVNRSPVVVGISTDGAAPILGQAIRRRIETVLPPALAEWGRLARELREKVVSRLVPGQQRRAFWERFADLAFGPAPTSADAGWLLNSIGDVHSDAANAAGRVTLVGAGPGDPELLTLKAVRTLQSADVILFDELVSNEVLELARREAKRMLVGKCCGQTDCGPQDINDLMAGLAKKGKHVVRLKLGDPMEYGGSDAEIAWLERDGIAVFVVAGISAASCKVSLSSARRPPPIEESAGEGRELIGAIA